MDKIKKYSEAIINLLRTHGANKIANMPKVKSRIIADVENHQYLLIWAGWDDFFYVHHVWYHFEIIDGKIWVLHNSTDVEVDKELMERGVKKADIIGAFVPDYLRDAA